MLKLSCNLPEHVPSLEPSPLAADKGARSVSIVCTYCMLVVAYFALGPLVRHEILLVSSRAPPPSQWYSRNMDQRRSIRA